MGEKTEDDDGKFETEASGSFLSTSVGHDQGSHTVERDLIMVNCQLSYPLVTFRISPNLSECFLH